MRPPATALERFGPFTLHPIHVARQSYALHFYHDNQREALGLVERH